MEFDRAEVLYFDCDQRGRNTNFDGKKNSSGTKERPFMILTLNKYNKQWHYDGMYALPLSSSPLALGNAYSLEIGTDSFEGATIRNMIGSQILCNKICRISNSDLSTRNHKIRLNHAFFRRVLKTTKKFCDETIF